ncbi:MAG: hypothetical protein JO072_01885 [Parafilimonas sp.]|nr:hypothetical protein [Parafilimonas sp.]
MLSFKRSIALLAFLFFSAQIFAQDNAVLLKEAQNLELKFDEAAALEKYKQIAANDASNIHVLVKTVELDCSIGNRQKDKTTKLQYFQAAQIFAQQAYTKDSSNADACYANALVATRMSEVDDDNKKLIEDIRQIKIYADKALAANANHARANYILGKWHFELIHSNWLKKSAVKNFYDKIPDTQVDSAAYYMEKCRSIEPYYALNYLDLAKVYDYDHQREKAIEVLEKLVKLPNRTFDDAAIKDEGKKMLATMQ